MGGAYLYEPDPMARALVLLFSLALVGRAIVTWTEHVFVAFESTHYALGCEFCFRLLESSVGLLLLVSGSKALPVAILHVLVWWLNAGVAILIIHRRLAPVGLHCTWQKALELFTTGWPLSLNIFCIGFFLQGPLVLYRSLASNDPQIGQLAVPLQAAAILCILPAAVSASVLPVLARLGQSTDRQDIRIVQTMIRLGYGFGAVVGLVGLALGPWLIDRVLGAQYAMAGTLIGPALWLLIPYTCGNVLTSFSLVRGRIRTVMVCSAVGVLVLVATIFPLTAWWGKGGVIAATAIALSCWASMVLAMEGGNIMLCVVRCLSWVGVTLASYIMVASHNALLALGVSLLLLLCSVPLFGIIQPHELRAVRQRYGF
jgi:O-antigen/teichoic acid export membrane protein